MAVSFCWFSPKLPSPDLLPENKAMPATCLYVRSRNMFFPDTATDWLSNSLSIVYYFSAPWQMTEGKMNLSCSLRLMLLPCVM